MRSNMHSNTLLALLASLLGRASAHGNMLCPKPRQYRDSKADVAGWTNWQGISIPGDGSFNPGPQNAANLNAGIGGGVANEFGSEPGSHGLCGDIGSRHGFTAPGRYGPTDPRGTYVAGGTMEVTARITAWHAGWFEFRLGVPADGGGNKEIPMTQALLNEHVLEIDPSTKDYDKVMNYAGMKGLGNWQDDGGLYKCPYTGGDATTGTPTNANPSAGFEDTTSNTPQKLWPHGTCCNDGGYCSPPDANKDRYVVEFSSDASSQTVSTYTIVLKVPADIECERCVLQWTYFTANSADTYPEVFWNCADVTIKAAASRAPGSSGPGDDTGGRAAPPAAAPPAAQPHGGGGGTRPASRGGARHGGTSGAPTRRRRCAAAATRTRTTARTAVAAKAKRIASTTRR